jgi:DUF4097 and DUF4098 domain-containing protein YvlB
MNLKTLAFIPVLALAGATVGCDDFDMDMGGARVEAPFHYSYDVNPGAHFELETFNGNVEIRSWDQNKVDISGTKFANSAALRDAIRIDTHATPDSVTIRTVRPSEHHGNMGAKFIVRVPHAMALDRIVNSNGGIRVENVAGPVHASTSNGGVTLSQIQGAVNADTSNGGIDLTDVTGNATLETSNGRIHVDHIVGVVQATSSNGEISLAFANAPKNDVHASTSNSSIEVSMPSSSPVRLRADTSNGSISSEFDVSSQGTASKNHLEGAINGGGPLLDLSTSNGSIKVVKP